MIAASELRIGNWFHWSIIASMGQGFDYIREAKEIGMYNQFKEPVPLTPEILEKCGFESRLSKNEYFILCSKRSRSDGLFIEITLFDFSCSIGQLNHFSHQFGEYKYLHQLQNLYFSLTGKELTVSL